MSYVIFSIDQENDPLVMHQFREYVAEKKSEGDLIGNCIPLIGSYKGQKENSFIMSLTDFLCCISDTLWIANQESILHAASGNKMEVYLEYIDGSGRPNEHLGCMHQVCEEEALDSDAYTFNPDLNRYWIAKPGNPDGSYRRSVEQYRKPIADVVDITVTFRASRKDLLGAAGMISRASTREAMCEVMQHSLYEKGPKLQGSFSIDEVREVQ